MSNPILEEAAGRLRDPNDALVFLDSDDYPDEASASRAIDKLLKERPYLGLSGPKPLTREDLRSMTPQQIEQARADGLLDHLLRRR